MTIKKIRTADLKTGMFVHEVEGSFPGAVAGPSGFRINSRNDIKNLLESNIQAVYIDTARSADPEEAVELAEDEALADLIETFEVDIDEFRIGRETPVDLYWINEEGEFGLLCRSGLTYTEEVDELFRGSGIDKVMIPVDQKRIYDLFIKTLEEEKEKKSGEDEYPSPEEIEAHVKFINNYYPISPVALIPGARADFDIFIKEENESIYTASEKGARVEEDLLGEWIEKDRNVLILKKDIEAYRAYMLENTKNSKNPRARASFVRENSRIIVESLAENPRSEKLMSETKETVKDLTQIVMDNPASFYSLMKINNYDYYTFTHSVNVSTLSLALAIAAGMKDKEELADLGLGCILHDLGKAKVDSSLINKPGKLTADEFAKVRNHVLLGHEMLKGNKSLSKRALIPLLQHHEKLSGGGYPNRLEGDDIHLFGRISAIMDIYDALTTERTYKKAFTPFDALALISKNKNDYDLDLFRLFVRLIHNQEI